MTTHPSPWRNPVLWLIVALPAVAVVAGVGMVVVASHDSDDAIADRVRRTAQVQVVDLGPDEQARQARLSAVLRVADGAVEALPVNGDFDRSTPLAVRLLHPADGTADVDLQLQPAGHGWRLEQAVDTSHDWNVQLAPVDGRWRLLGRLPRGQQAIVLQPALREQP